jgi:ribosomal protein L10
MKDAWVATVIAVGAPIQVLVCNHDRKNQSMTAHPNIYATPYRQFPLRLTHDMANDLDRIAARTRINKTTISRIALQKFISEIERTGVDEMLDGVCAV